MIEIIRDRNALANIRDEWNELAKLFCTPLLSHEWFTSCAEAFYEEDNLRVVVVSSNSNVLAIAPLVVIRKRGFEQLEILGSSFLGEPGGLLYDNEKSLRFLLDGIFGLSRPFYLQRISISKSLSKFFNPGSLRRGIILRRKTSGSAYIPINTTWNDFYSSLSSKRRYDLRRARRKADKFGNISFKIFCPNSKELEQKLEIAFKIEATGWKGHKGSALLTNKKLNIFFKRYAFLASKKGILRLCFLFIDAIPVATLIGLENYNRFWVLKIGYDEKFSKCSPGVLLIHETIHYAFEKRLRSYEFLGSDEPWLHMWTKKNLRKYKSIGHYPVNYPGLAAFTIDTTRFGYKKLYEYFSK